MTSLILVALPAAPSFDRVEWPAVPPAADVDVTLDDFKHLPLNFEPNLGQAAAPVDWFTRAPGYGVYLTGTSVTLATETASGSTAVTMKMLGADRGASSTALDRLPGHVNYFKGNDPSEWLTDISTFGRIRYEDVYPGIDVLYYGNGGRLEYDFVVSPGSNADRIRLVFKGADARLAPSGDLVLASGRSAVRMDAPVLYQEIDGQRRAVDGRYVGIHKNEFGFEIGSYDHSRSLIIDPVIVYSTYLGGSDDDGGAGIAVDAAGNAYVHGHTFSTNFPTVGPIFGSYAGSKDGFVAKLNAAGTALVYSTYLGGNGEEKPRTIAVDESGNAYAAGSTGSTNFPVANAYQPTFGGDRDNYLTKLNAAGNGLVFSTYLGGHAAEGRANVAVDDSGSAYVAGFTSSSTFPLVNPIQADQAGLHDIHVTKFTPAGNSLVYSTFLGGSSHDTGRGLAVDSAGNAYVHGWTFSDDFPTANALQPNFAGVADTVVAKINPSGSSLVYSTYLGGSGQDMPYLGQSIDVDSAGNVVFTGHTQSANWPTANAVQPTFGGVQDAYVAKLSASGGSLIFSTFLGGTKEDSGITIALDDDDNILTAGQTFSGGFPILDAFQPTKKGTTDAFVSKLTPAGALVWSSFLGGDGKEDAFGIAVDDDGDAYVTGSTNSTNFPTASPIQPAVAGSGDAYVVKIDSGSGPPPPNDTTPPTVTLSSPAADTLLTSTAVATTWSGSDNVGVTRYDVYQRIGTSGNEALVQSSLATSYSRVGALGETYCYRVVAFDAAGNSTSSEVRCQAVPYDDRDGAISYTAPIARVSVAGAYEGTVTILQGAGGAALSFTGRKAGFLVQRNPASGRASIYVDGVFKRTVDLYGAEIRNKQYIHTENLSYGPHTVEFRWAGTKRPTSTSKDVSLDGIAVIE